MDKVLHSSKSNEWETPHWLFERLNAEFNFELDAAATTENFLCPSFYTKEDDALTKDWAAKTVWLNPPYGRLIGKFVKKTYEESVKGCTIVLLIPARVDTKWWHEYCALGEVRFIKGRLKFNNRTFPSWRSDGSHKVSPAPFPCAIIIFRGKEPKTEYISINK